MRLGWMTVASLAIATPAFGEGSQQFGSGDQGLNVFLFEYNASNSFIQGTNRPIYVNVENANDVINVSLCGWRTTDDLAIEVFRPSGSEINYNTQVTNSPGVFSNGAGSGNGAWLITSPNARTVANGSLCNDRLGPDQPSLNSTLSNPVRFTAPEAGTYEIRLYNDSESSTSTNNVFTYFDITVTPNAFTNPNPRANNGQLWADSWALNAGNTFGQTGGYDADLYIRTPGGQNGTEFIWQLDLNNFAPQRHEIVANGIGLDAPDSRTSAPGSSGASYTRDFPIYVSPPNTSSSVLPILPEPPPPSISDLRFIDNANQDSSISPNSSTGVQDAGFFQFNTDTPGTYQITIDTNLNGSFDNGDRILFGSSTIGNNSVFWDGEGLGGAALATGTYPAQVRIGLGEYHFTAFDAETSGGGANNGLSIWKWNPATATRSTATNYWDDTRIGGTNNRAGGISGTPGGTHTWGNFTGGGIGNVNFIDTWVFATPQESDTSVIIADQDDNDFGDAPDVYGTDVDISVGGIPASHLISPSVYLGASSPDAETNGQPSNTAQDDDNNGSDDEDGVSGFSAPNANSFQAMVTVNNTSGSDAYLVGWVDFNRNNLFDANESATYDADPNTAGIQPIATGTTNSTVALTWNSVSGLTGGNTYARFRITTDTNIANATTAQSTGAAADGEVEDYQFFLTPFSSNAEVLLIKRITAIQGQTLNPNDQTTQLNQFIDDTTSPQQANDNAAGWPNNYILGAIDAGPVQPGDTVEYTVYFLNSGDVPVEDLRLCDRLQSGLVYEFGAYPGAADLELHLGDRTTGTTYSLTATDDPGPTGDRAQLVPSGSTPSNCNLQAVNDNGTLVVDVTGPTNSGSPAITELRPSTSQGSPNDSYGFFRFTVKVPD